MATDGGCNQMLCAATAGINDNEAAPKKKCYSDAVAAEGFA